MAVRLIPLSSVCGAALAATLLLPSAALAEPSSQGQQHRATPAASHQPQASPKPKGDKKPKGDEKRADRKSPPQATPTRGPSDRPGLADPKGKRGGNASTGGNSDSTDPAGNNGTIKIDYPVGDSGHANRPHPGCGFQLRMFNFDDDQYGLLTVTGQAPTSTDTLLSRRVLLSDDAAGGGQDVDQVYSFSKADLGLTGTPASAQGWHLKVAVDAEGAPGGAKQKVFWLDCPSVEGGSVVAPRANFSRLPAVELAPAVVTSELTVVANAASNPTAFSFFTGNGGLVRGFALPFTGVELPYLLMAAALSLGLGTLAVRAGRRRITPVS